MQTFSLLYIHFTHISKIDYFVKYLSNPLTILYVLIDSFSILTTLVQRNLYILKYQYYF